jgi:hypothetical protein
MISSKECVEKVNVAIFNRIGVRTSARAAASPAAAQHEAAPRVPTLGLQLRQPEFDRRDRRLDRL